MERLPSGFLFVRFTDERLGASRDFRFHRLIKAGEKLRHRLVKNCRICERGSQARLTNEAFIPTGFGTAFRAKKDSNIFLRKCETLALGTQIVGELR